MSFGGTHSDHSNNLTQRWNAWARPSFPNSWGSAISCSRLCCEEQSPAWSCGRVQRLAQVHRKYLLQEGASWVSSSLVIKAFFFPSWERHYKYFAKGKSRKICVLKTFSFWVSLGTSERRVEWYVSPGPLRSKRQDAMKRARVLWGQTFVRENGWELGRQGELSDMYDASLSGGAS